MTSQQDKANPPPTRPILRYHGGKWKLAPWITSFFPQHRIYVEPFGGAASVLLRKERSYAEVYNDLDSEIVNLFRVVRDREMAVELERMLRLTPFARDEFMLAYCRSADPLQRAHSMVVRAFMGFGSAAMTRTHQTGFRANSNRSGTTPAHDWVNWPDQITAITSRLQGVVIENRNAFDVMAQHDGPQTLFYVDPPYPHETRSAIGRSRTHLYRHEMTDEDHIMLGAQLKNLEGMVVLSGYPCDLYDNVLYKDWQRYEREALADGARKRTEVLWLNEAAANALRTQGDMFSRFSSTHG
jgi:DNA adenine methylase